LGYEGNESILDILPPKISFLAFDFKMRAEDDSGVQQMQFPLEALPNQLQHLTFYKPDGGTYSCQLIFTGSPSNLNLTLR